MSETFICSHCGDRFDIEERNYFDGSELCDDCYDEEDLVELERNFSKSLAKMAGYENEDAFWDSMI